MNIDFNGNSRLTGSFLNPDTTYLEFFDGPSGLSMRLIHPEQNDQWAGWILYQDKITGQWKSLRKATDSDLREIHRSVKEIEARRKKLES